MFLKCNVIPTCTTPTFAGSNDHQKPIGNALNTLFFIKDLCKTLESQCKVGVIYVGITSHLPAGYGGYEGIELIIQRLYSPDKLLLSWGYINISKATRKPGHVLKGPKQLLHVITRRLPLGTAGIGYGVLSSLPCQKNEKNCHPIRSAVICTSLYFQTSHINVSLRLCHENLRVNYLGQ